MTLLTQYIQKEVIRYFLIVMVTVLGIYLTVDFFQRIDNFISENIGGYKILLYFLCNLPTIIVQIIPVCLLLSVVIALGLMNKYNEIIALKSCGIGFSFIVKPVLMVGISGTVILFLLSEILVPLTVPVSNRIWIEDIKKKNMVTTEEKDIWIKGNHSITHITYYNPFEKKIYNISLYSFNHAFALAKRTDAEMGEFVNGRWTLHNIMDQTLNEVDGKYKTDLFDRQTRDLDLLPEDLTRVIKKSEEMTYRELLSYIGKVEDEGYDATIYKVDLYGKKTALPFVCIIMALVGAGIGVKKHIKEGLPVGVAYGIGITFLYWIFFSFCMSLGYGGVIPPLPAAWLPNLVFLSWGVYLGLNN
ncbi:MAG: LPS export ABC transporter permease LptG [Proteobacteria bacterium]|nr:LPS export ABC transporter permease LptG [Pseudomonadota bacterium]MBU4470663.1 LPS export ABC transporter permease LptG [Pseudomonadota bacterium]MCG2751242.1 LPS export ABC transporter permease LptG [Desulfobacteraceae bacterium]